MLDDWDNASFLIRNVDPGLHAVYLDQHLGSDTRDVTVEVEKGELGVVRVSDDGSQFDVDVFTVSTSRPTL